MRDKDSKRMDRLGDHAKAEVLKKLQRGDQAEIARMLGTQPDTVKKNLRYRPTAQSVLSNRIWLTALRLVRMREQLMQMTASETSNA